MAAIIFIATVVGLSAISHMSRNELSEAPAIPNTRNPEPLSLPPFDSRIQSAIRLTQSGMRTEISAVDPHAFHVVMGQTNTRSGPPSPFVVETSALHDAQLSRARGGSQLSIKSASAHLENSGAISVADSHKIKIIWGAKWTLSGKNLSFSFEHEPGRIYGSGNASLGVSGGLVHTSGVSSVGNGWTRIPFVWSPSGFGILVANNIAGIGWTDDGTRMRWTIPADYADIYIIAASNAYTILDAYSRLTGRAPVPPPWTFGFMQSRWGYVDAADVREKWDRFRDLHIPVDAFIYDYDWFVDDWHFNPITFPNPSADLAEMHRRGLHFVGIRKPRVHADHLNYAQQRHWTLFGADLRFDRPDVRSWWAGAHVPLLKDGVDGWWNDEAENAYDQFFYMNVAERDSWLKETKKPFWSLNRAFAPGMQRLGAAAWTGDIPTSWQSLQNQPGTMLNWGLCGMPYVGQDIGGFTDKPSPELYVRWMQEGALVPVMRAHGIQNSPRWPWAFGPVALKASRNAILLRNKLRPYLLACAKDTARTGAPIMRPLFLEFPNDKTTYNMEHEWLIGRDLLAAPVLYPSGKSDVYLPRGKWRVYSTGRTITGPTWLHRTVSINTIPLYVRQPASVDGKLLH